MLFSKCAQSTATTLGQGFQVTYDVTNKTLVLLHSGQRASKRSLGISIQEAANVVHRLAPERLQSGQQVHALIEFTDMRLTW